MDDGFVTSADGLFLYHQRLVAYKWLRHGFSLRRSLIDGREMSLGFNGYQPRETVIENRRVFVQSLWGCDLPLTLLKQTHSNLVLSVPQPEGSTAPLEGDGLVTSEPDLPVSVQTADCLPVLLVDPRRRVIAAIHAGWRGMLKQILAKAVRLMQAEFAANPQDCVAVAGPSIRGCCYEVSEEVVEPFTKEFDYAASLFRTPGPGEATREGAQYLDLSSACRQQLLDVELLSENIYTNGPCTSCQRHLFFSHRADKGHTGRALAVIGMTF
jgi:YfiH family protein